MTFILSYIKPQNTITPRLLFLITNQSMLYSSKYSSQLYLAKYLKILLLSDQRTVLILYDFNRMQMHPKLIRRWDTLQYEWMSSWKPVCPYKCCYIHDTPCLYEFIRKLLTVCKIGVKYYIFFHILPLILRIKKARSPHEKGRAALRTLLEYFKSILFMGFLVGLSKGALCIKNNLSLPLDGYFMTWQSSIAGTSIFWEERSRQREIGYFILAKALRSIYMVLKRLGWLKLSGEAVWMHILLMAALSYVFHHYPDNLKYHSTFALIWGKD